MDVELQGRTAKAHIEKWQQYGEKAQQHATSAAIIIKEIKESLNIRQYGMWLMKYEIAGRTASRLLLEHEHPEKKEERQVKQREANEEAKVMRREAKERKAAEAMHGRQTVDKPLETRETPISIPTGLEVLKNAVKQLSVEEFQSFKQWFREYCGA